MEVKIEKIVLLSLNLHGCEIVMPVAMPCSLKKLWICHLVYAGLPCNKLNCCIKHGTVKLFCKDFIDLIVVWTGRKRCCSLLK